MVEFRPRVARIVLVTGEGQLLGALPPVQVATPWRQDIVPLAEAVRAAYGIDITVLRLLSADDAEPHGDVGA